MNIKKTLLPLAIAAATMGGISLSANRSNAPEPTVKETSLSEKDIFNYMEHTSTPIKHDNRVNLAISLFGIGLAGVKRKKEVIDTLDNVESKVQSSQNEYMKRIILNKITLIKEMIINSDKLELTDITVLKTRVDSLSYSLELLGNKEIYADYQSVVDIINRNLNNTDEEYKKQCLNEVDEITDSLRTISTAPILANEHLKMHINSLIRLIMEGESDYSDDIKQKILSLLDKYNKLVDNSSNITKEEFIIEGYQMIPMLKCMVEQYTSTKDDWESGKSTTKNRYPQNYNYSGYTEEYAHFSSQVLNDCLALKRATKNQEIKLIGTIVRQIKNRMINYGTYNNTAFGNTMFLCDYILSSHIDSSGKAYNLGALQFRVKALLENVYLSVNNPECNRPYGTVPRTFSEWEYEMKDIEKINKEIAPKKERIVVQGEKVTAVDKKKKVNNNDDDQRITFESVGGQDEAIELLKKKVLYPLRYPNAFKNRMINHGIIMHGRPGTGKTLIALALSNESKSNFIKINAAELTSSLHGETDKNWRDLFKQAREQQPCIIFIDEFDTVAQKRGHNATNNYDDTVVNTILTEMSDIEKNGDNIYVIGATNRFDVLDSGILRAGRFGTHIELKAPKTVKDVLQIFDIHTKDKTLADDIDKNKIAELLLKKDVTGSDIASIINEALENTFLRLGIYEKMENGTFNDSDLSEIKITMNDITEAIENYHVNTDNNSGAKPVIGFNRR